MSKRLISQLARIALAGACTILLAGPALSKSEAGSVNRPMVTAHRGGASLLPENTFPAFDNAIRLGVDMLEFDMVMTADDNLVIYHDTAVNSTFCDADPSSGVVAGPIRKLTLAQMLKFDCGSKQRDIYPTQKTVPGTRIPTLDAFLARYKDTSQLLFAETKMPRVGEGEVDPVAFTRRIDASVRQFEVEDRFILQSSDWRTLDAMHAINPRIRTCLLKPWLSKFNHLDLVRRHHATCILLRHQDADAAQVRRLQKAGIMIMSEVIDDEVSWRAYRARGDDALFTNDPAALIQFLGKDRKRK